MYCFGSTLHGELGLGATQVEQVTLPQYSDFPESKNVVHVSSGLTHTLILTTEGRVYSCGNNEVGQLGHNKITRKPELVDALEPYRIIQVNAGDQHSVALSEWGHVYAWGENGFGQLGLNSSDSVCFSPALVKSIAALQVVQVACGSNHTLALTSGGVLYSWGLNRTGQLGLGHRSSHVCSPVLVKSLVGLPVRQVAAGGLHSIVVSQSGYLLTWGSNKYGQLGYSLSDDATFSCNPNVVPSLASYSEPLKYVSAGDGHTAVLDSCGKLWTFGYGRYGQLGHGTYSDTLVPRTVLDLIGSKVVQVACGRCHTLVFLPSQIFAFGQGMCGQLGIKTAGNINLPQATVGSWLSPGGHSLLKTGDEADSMPFPKHYVSQIFAGGDASFVRVSNVPNVYQDYTLFSQFQQPLTIEESKINALIKMNEEDVIDDELFMYLETAFGSIACWNQSFLCEDVSASCHNIRLELAEACFQKLSRITRDAVSSIVNQGVVSVVKNLPKNALTKEMLRCFLLLPLCQSFSNLDNLFSLQSPYAVALLGLSGHSLDLIKKWFCEISSDFLTKLLAVYKGIVVLVLNNYQSNTQAHKNSLEITLELLEFLYIENKKRKARRLAYESFYIPEIGQKVDMKRDYTSFVSSQHNMDGRVCFCKFPFLFDSLTKTALLREDALWQMQGAVNEAVHNTNPIVWLINPGEVQFLNLYINRNRIVQDTIEQLVYKQMSALKRPLKIHFIGEEADDAGGVRKEFFLLIIREILNPDYGMFQEYPETRAIWFREEALETNDMFSLIGIVCGLAIYNFTIINLPFPLALYKKLLEEELTLEDLVDLDPSLMRNLNQILDYDGPDFEDVFCFNFTITRDFFGTPQTIPLKPDGENIPVTLENKQEYVNLYVDYKLNRSIEQQYRAFHRAFYHVCGASILRLFQPIELMSLVTGNENYDWEELQKNTEYKGVFYTEHPTIKLFWEVFYEMTLDQKKKFLLFLTGTDRIPIVGMKAIKMIIQPTSDDSYLPVAHTCVTQLDLPIYSTKEKLKYKLHQAIQQSEGFGLV